LRFLCKRIGRRTGKQLIIGDLRFLIADLGNCGEREKMCQPQSEPHRPLMRIFEQQSNQGEKASSNRFICNELAISRRVDFPIWEVI
jgi:hypothetical protein